MKIKISLLAISLLALTACDTPYLTHQQKIDRSNYPLTPINITPTAQQSDQSNPNSPPIIEQDVGTYTFSVPPNLTLMKETNGNTQRYQIFDGRPAPEDKPILTITVGGTASADSETGIGGLTVNKKRSYILNNLTVQEWQGYTPDNKPYCEIIGQHLGAGDQLHALAIGRTPELGKQALQILSTITWVPTAGAASQPSPDAAPSPTTTP